VARVGHNLALRDVFFADTALVAELPHLIKNSIPAFDVRWGWHGQLFVRFVLGDFAVAPNSVGTAPPPKLLFVAKEASRSDGPCCCANRDAGIPCTERCYNVHTSCAAFAVGIVELANPFGFVTDFVSLCTTGCTSMGRTTEWRATPRGVLDATTMKANSFVITDFYDDRNFSFIADYPALSHRYYRCTAPELVTEFNRLCCLGAVDDLEHICTTAFSRLDIPRIAKTSRGSRDRLLGFTSFNDTMLQIADLRRAILEARQLHVDTDQGVISCPDIKRELGRVDARATFRLLYACYARDVVESVNAMRILAEFQ